MNYIPNTEEAELLAFFESDKHKGFFVEVGANHPTNLSTSYPFEQAGWNGIVIEPLPDHAEALRKGRKAKVYECACGEPDDPPTLTLCVADVASYISGRGVLRGIDSDHSITVECTALDRILETEKVTRIDLLSIDVEGSEINVLRGFSIKKYMPRLVFIEYHVLSLNIHYYMKENGYKLIKRTGVNNWYIPRSSQYKTPFLDRIKLIRKMYLGTPLRIARNKLLRST